MIMSHDAVGMRLPVKFCMLVLIAFASRASSSAATCPAGAIQRRGCISVRGLYLMEILCKCCFRVVKIV